MKKQPIKVKLTQPMVRNMEPPESGRPIIYDTEVPSFGIRLTPNGARTFVVYQRIDGQPAIFKVGSFPQMNVDSARTEARKLVGQIAEGKNPQAVKRAKRSEATLGKYWQDEYWPNHASKKAGPGEYQSRYDHHLKRWANRRLSEISFQEVQRLHRQISKEAPISANRLVSLIHHLFQQARRDGFFSGDNPASGIKRNEEVQRERFLEPDEAPRFFEALAENPNETFQNYVWLSILTGQRQRNICSMRFDEIDFSSATWTIPRHKTKSGKKSIRVALHDEAMRILRERHESIDGDFVLPGPGKSKHYIGPKKAWATFIKRAKITDFRPHDLRHTLGSWQAITGGSQAIIAKALGHSNVATASIYTHVNIDPVRESVEKALDTLLAVGKVKQPARVLDLKQRQGKGA